MNAPHHHLDQIQRWMQFVITHPDGVVGGIESEGSRNVIDVSATDVETVIQPSETQTSIERLQVYSNAYYARLLECMQSEFPAMVNLIGQDAFDGFVFGYLQQYPSRSYTLSNLSAHFPRYLDESRPDEIDTEKPSWIDLLIELARLERAYSEVFDGPGVEGKELLKADELLQIPAEHWPDSKLILVPCLRLMTLQFPVHEFATAVRRKEEAIPPKPSPTWLCITRRDYIVRRCPLSKPQFELLTALLAGDCIGNAIANAAATTDVDIDDLAGDLRRWFRDWAAAEFFQAIKTPT